MPSRAMRRRPWVAGLGVAYIAAVAALGGLRPDHVFIGLLGLLDLYNEKSRLFLRVFFPFILTGVVFDSMRYFYRQGIGTRVHVVEPYELERRWFGVGGRTLNEIFAEHHWSVLDVLCGFAYLTYVGEYLILAFVLFFRRRPRSVLAMATCFLVMNLMAFATYFIYPAAPPWYVSEYGLGPVNLDVRPSAAAAERFDALLGIHLFASMYGRGIAVFCAIPSMHVAYPLAAAVFAFTRRELRWARWPTLWFFLLMCLSAVYLQHHYVLDAIAGIIYALLAVKGVTVWERRRAA